MLILNLWGGDLKQPLTKISEVEHKELHRDMYKFLRQEIDEYGNHMKPQKGNSGDAIQKNFSRDKLLDALKRFYEEFRDKYPKAAEDFFKQHPDLEC